ncbi:MAG: hypothetical protein HYR55_01755 [Acidobacteria bacterium]|nr:hypothetical protein [Acidobacteriota bacterium]MBI3654810.1 hypothetical protein [Acidobacteriota bacterium]
MKKFLALTLSLVLAMALSTMSFAAPQAAKAKAKPAAGSDPKPTKSGTHSTTGNVVSISATEITVKNAKGSKTISIPADFKVPAGLKADDRATVTYKQDGDKMTATAIKAAKPAAAKAAGKKAPAAKEKEKKPAM